MYVLTREGVPMSRVDVMRNPPVHFCMGYEEEGNEGPLLTASSYLHGL